MKIKKLQDGDFAEVGQPSFIVDNALAFLQKKRDEDISRMTFSKAFTQARKQGLTEFDWFDPKLGATRKIAVKMATTSNSKPTAKVDTVTSTAKTPIQQIAETVLPTAQTIDNRTYLGNNAKALPEIVVTANRPKSTTIQTPKVNKPEVKSSLPVTKTYTEKKGLDNSKYWKEQFSKPPTPRKQQGGQIELRSFWEKLLGIKPQATKVNDTESTRRWRDGNIETREIIQQNPTGNLISTMKIKNPDTNKADTTFIQPNGQKPTTNLPNYKDKFTRYFKYQEGGKLGREELIMDFALRYLKALGKSEEELKGGLDPESEGLVVNAIKSVDSPEFWEDYEQDPDSAVQNFMNEQTNPELAKKGAKLKKLSKTTKKCKCGCNMVMKKEGGKLVQVCGCGCKNK